MISSHVGLINTSLVRLLPTCSPPSSLSKTALLWQECWSTSVIFLRICTVPSPAIKCTSVTFAKMIARPVLYFCSLCSRQSDVPRAVFNSAQLSTCPRTSTSQAPHLDAHSFEFAYSWWHFHNGGWKLPRFSIELPYREIAMLVYLSLSCLNEVLVMQINKSRLSCF